MSDQKKITIVHIVPKFLFGGAERLVALYAKLHDPELYDVHVIACVEDGELRPEIEQGHAHVFAASRSTYVGRWGAWKALKNYLDPVQPDIIHTHLLTSDVIGWWYRTRANKRPLWISSQHNVEDSRPWLYKKIWRYILPQADGVIAVAPRVYDYAHTKFGVPKERLHLVLNGIALDKWIPAGEHIPCSNSSVLRIGTIGRFELQKGHTYALEALAELDESVPWEYHLFGDGALRSDLEAQAAALGVMDRIVWHGVVHNVHEQIKDIDVVLQPSLFEGLSLVILEAMTAGRIVLTTPAGGEGVIEHRKSGYIVPSANPEAIATELKYIYQHQTEAVRAAVAAAAYAQAHFSIEESVKSIESVYQSLVS